MASMAASAASGESKLTKAKPRFSWVCGSASQRVGNPSEGGAGSGRTFHDLALDDRAVLAKVLPEVFVLAAGADARDVEVVACISPKSTLAAASFQRRWRTGVVGAVTSTTANRPSTKCFRPTKRSRTYRPRSTPLIGLRLLSLPPPPRAGLADLPRPLVPASGRSQPAPSAGAGSAPPAGPLAHSVVKRERKEV